MISNKTPGNRRTKLLKMPKNIEQLYKEGKCSECSVVVTRMDFAKILGKFTKVKIQYESTSTPKTKKSVSNNLSPNSNTRLKSNENGMVLIHRNVYNQHPVAELLNKKAKTNVKPSAKNKNIEPFKPNILKENNRLKKSPVAKDKAIYNIKQDTTYLKQYGVIFSTPVTNNNNDFTNELTLIELLPSIDQNILPSEDWSIDYLPKDGEPKEDKVYDRIAAELEDLMYNEGPGVKPDKTETESKDDFPSIMDILNENAADNMQTTNQSNPIQSSLESSDVEAMLLGKSRESPVKEAESGPMEVDNSVINNLIDVVQLSESQDNSSKLQVAVGLDNPHSPSILDEALQTGIEEHLPKEGLPNNSTESAIVEPQVKNEGDKITKKQNESPKLKITSITHVVFKKRLNGECLKSVTCPKNLKYSVELEGKSVEFLGAPKYISSAEDLKVLLQIVNETDLNSLYVLH